MGNVFQGRAPALRRRTAARRFEEVRLGQRLDPVVVDVAATLEERARYLVLSWSGSAAAQILSCRSGQEHCGEALAGRVIARHLDGSRLVAVEVRDASPGRAAVAVVRVALA